AFLPGDSFRLGEINGEDMKSLQQISTVGGIRSKMEFSPDVSFRLGEINGEDMNNLQQVSTVGGIRSSMKPFSQGTVSVLGKSTVKI
ncbi:MAG: hypothetical protein IJJ38_08540, partial [Lachnospiraceae bacterium]|nr:hypothetical protein [Lachnospiraceae bacterium]